MPIEFEVERIDTVSISAPDELLSKQLMSPFVWQEKDDARLHMLVRAVPSNKDEQKTESGRIWYGQSGSNGLFFQMDAAPTIVPGPGGKDVRGCEDPTVVQTKDGYTVLYTGVDGSGTGHMLYATGSTIASLEKRGVALADSKTENNVKEATVLRDGDTWRLLYEYAHKGHSLISLAYGEGVAGPWNEQPDPFGIRKGHWDSFHLSTGPLWRGDPEMPVMFYNGADENTDWGIGWVAFSPDLSRVVARSDKPLISAPTDVDGPKDIAFAASLVDNEGALWLYYSRNDRELRRATIRIRR
ncbi:glycosidase [Sphingomonas sp. LR59]|uniref:glycoside hydrolase family 130 protein n=1 Tax=Sphingomonas sp. LR59 TaxID=3050232 RepID=UPI002FE0581B